MGISILTHIIRYNSSSKLLLNLYIYELIYYLNKSTDNIIQLIQQNNHSNIMEYIYKLYNLEINNEINVLINEWIFDYKNSIKIHPLSNIMCFGMAFNYWNDNKKNGLLNQNINY